MTDRRCSRSCDLDGQRLARRAVAFGVLLVLGSIIGTADAVAQEGAASTEPPTERLPTASDVAQRAYDVFETQCANVQRGQLGVGQDEALAAVTSMRLEVTRAVERTGERFLRYWRAALGECYGNTSGALEDYREFILGEAKNPTFRGLVADARRRYKRLGGTDLPRQEPSTTLSRPGGGAAPRVSLALGAAWQPTGGQHYGAVVGDLRFGLVGPLWAGAVVRTAVGPAWSREDGGVSRSVLTTFGGGLGLRAVGGPLEPEVFIDAVVAPNPETGKGPALVGVGGEAGGAVLVGPQLGGGVTVPFGSSPLGLRIGGEFLWLHPYPVARVGLALHVRIGGGG